MEKGNTGKRNIELEHPTTRVKNYVHPTTRVKIKNQFVCILNNYIRYWKNKVNTEH